MPAQESHGMRLHIHFHPPVEYSEQWCNPPTQEICKLQVGPIAAQIVAGKCSGCTGCAGLGP